MSTPLSILTAGWLADANLFGLNGHSVQTGLPFLSSPNLSDGTVQPAPGPYYFAWVDSTETTFGTEHHVTDIEVFAFELVHSEGEFPELRVDVKNPRVGLLNPSRKQWVWFSFNDGLGVITPLFFGRIVGIPQQMQDEIVRLQFMARPSDFDNQKRTLADTMKVAPFWDPLFIPEERWDEPDAVLEARPELWHIDRTTHVVTTSDIIQGEDGTESIAGNYFYDSLAITYTQAPAKTVRVRAEVGWEQRAVGTIDISRSLPKIVSLTGYGLIDDWPEKDDSFGGSWSVASTDPGLWQSALLRDLTVNGFQITTPIFSKTRFYGIPVSAAYMGIFDEVTLNPRMKVKHDVSRNYTEMLEFDLDADIQPLIADAGDDDIIELTLGGEADILADVDGSGNLQVPIANRASNRYFATARGATSIQYAIAAARAQLLFRARAIDITFEMPIASGFPLSLRKSATIVDDRIPGGQATGKIKNYILTLNGDTGIQHCQVTLGCTVGNAGTVSAANGTPVYVVDGYVELNYQQYAAQSYEVVSGEVTYDDISDMIPMDDGVDFGSLTRKEAVVSVTVFNEATAQFNYLEQNRFLNVFGKLSWPDGPKLASLLNEVFTEIEVDLLDFAGGPFETPIMLTTSVLKIPKTIDLEAAAI